MTKAYFVSDLHGAGSRYQALFQRLAADPPDLLFLGGDLFPGALRSLFDPMTTDDFMEQVLIAGLDTLRKRLGSRYPDIFVILGNDDGRYLEACVLDMASSGYWHYLHNRHVSWRDYELFGYNYVPPSPFRLKDWERYDVSRYVDPGCTAPGEGVTTVPLSDWELNWSTMADDLGRLTEGWDMTRSILLFHAPPYQTLLDRAALDGKMFDYVPLDVHVGSIAVKRLIEEKQPLLTLHGHIHEASDLTGAYHQRIGRTLAVNGAVSDARLSLISIPLPELDPVQRFLL